MGRQADECGCRVFWVQSKGLYLGLVSVACLHQLPRCCPGVSRLCAGIRPSPPPPSHNPHNPPYLPVLPCCTRCLNLIPIPILSLLNGAHACLQLCKLSRQAATCGQLGLCGRGEGGCLAGLDQVCAVCWSAAAHLQQSKQPSFALLGCSALRCTPLPLQACSALPSPPCKPIQQHCSYPLHPHSCHVHTAPPAGREKADTAAAASRASSSSRLA